MVAALVCPRPCSPALAQSLDARIAAVHDGKVRMSFAAKPGVCGHGKSIQTWRASDDWQWDCDHGPVRVVLTLRDREIVDLDTYVGGRWRARAAVALDLGQVPAPEAADYLLSVAERTDTRAGRDAILGAVLADSVELWPRLLRLARDGTRPREIRKSAVFWLGQAAGEAAIAGLGQLVEIPDEDTEVKESAIFALSQLRGGAGVEPLIQIARHNPDPRLRRKALFWLGQSEDPRVLALFEELLLRR